MNQTIALPEITPDDFLRMPGREHYELLDGRLVERHVSTWSSYVAGVVFAILNDFCRAHHAGWMFPEGTSYQCFPFAPNRVRKPDTSFIRLERLSAAQAMEGGHIRVTPDLAVEVVSPNDLACEVEEKLLEYLNANVPLVWVVYPQSRTVHVYHPDGLGRLLREQDELTGENILPGFRFPVRDLFVPPTPPTANGGPAA